MLSPVRKALRIKKADKDRSDDEAIADDLLWSTDLEKHAYGEFSLAVAQANAVLEDYSQVEARKDLTFVGVYDGHGGPDASLFLSNHAFTVFNEAYEKKGGRVSLEILRLVISEMERYFTKLVRKTYGSKPSIAAMGSSCSIGVICGGALYIVHIGDSRAVMGVSVPPNKIIRAVMGGSVWLHKIRAERLTKDHNVNSEEERKEARSKHPNDPKFVVKRKGRWLIKGFSQVSRSIGDAYLKHPELAIGSDTDEPITKAVLRRDPFTYSRNLRPCDRFLIFASSGFWQHISDQAAVDTVNRHPHAGIAKRLVKKALKKAAKKEKTDYDRLKQMNQGKRREVHDDITVAVIFIEYEWLKRDSPVLEVSIKGFPGVDLAVSSSGPDEPGPSLAVSGTDESSNPDPDEHGPSGTAEPSDPGARTTELPGFKRREGKEHVNPAADTSEPSTSSRSKGTGIVINN